MTAPAVQAPAVTRIERSSPRGRSHYPPWAGLLGLVVATSGALVGLFGYREANGTSQAVAVTMGAVFVLAGLLLAWTALRSLAARRRVAAAGGRQPWRWDHPWDIRAAEDEGWARTRHAAFVALFLALFLVPFHFAVVQAPGFLRWFPMLIVAGFDLVLLGIAGTAVYFFLQRMRWGGTRVEYGEFPLRTGREVRLFFRGGERLVRRSGLRATLLCVRERYERSGSDSSTFVAEAVHREEQTFDTDGMGVGALHFALPAGAPGTDFTATPPHYWELEVTLATPGIDYRGVFLLPVYGADG